MINFWENQCHLHTVVSINNIGVYAYQYQYSKHRENITPIPTRSLLIEPDDYHVRFGNVKIGMKTLVKGFVI